MFFGIFLVVVGLVFLGQNLGFISAGVWDILWPVLIVALGVSLLGKRSCRWCWGWGKKDSCCCGDGECADCGDKK